MTAPSNVTASTVYTWRALVDICEWHHLLKYEPTLLGSSQCLTWFLAAICLYSRVMVGMPDSHVQRICPGLLHVSDRRCTTWRIVNSHSSQMKTVALLVTCPVQVDDLRERKLFRLILSLTGRDWVTRHSLTNVSYCFCPVCSRFRIELITTVSARSLVSRTSRSLLSSMNGFSISLINCLRAFTWLKNVTCVPFVCSWCRRSDSVSGFFIDAWNSSISGPNTIHRIVGLVGSVWCLQHLHHPSHRRCSAHGLGLGQYWRMHAPSSLLWSCHAEIPCTQQDKCLQLVLLKFLPMNMYV